MTRRGTQTYCFESRAHWDRCLTDGFDAPDSNGLPLPPRLGAFARPIERSWQATAVATDRFGAPTWRGSKGDAGGQGIGWRDEFDITHGPYPVDEIVSRTTRLMVDRHWRWAFVPDRVARYDCSTLQLDLTIDLADLAASPDAELLDIAVDTREGVWLLIGEAGKQRFVHLDSRGCVAVTWPAPCEIKGATEIAVMDRGATLVLLAPGDLRLFLVSAADGKLRRTVRLGGLDGCLKPQHIASDGAGRLGLSAWQQNASAHEWQFFLLDRFGEIIRAASAALFRDPNDPNTPAAVEPVDFAVASDRVWFASADGLWLLDASEASGSAEVSATLLTPLLHSPPSDAGRGWLRAEIEIALPEGTEVKASFATTDDPQIASRVSIIAANEDLPHAVRQRTIWSLLDTGSGTSRQFCVSGGGRFAGRFEIPLFGTGHAWLAVKLDLGVPPFVALPCLKRMRVIYPEQSLMRHLPAIFANPENDPETVLRRLVGVAEATTQGIDATIASIGRNLDADEAPEEWLDYLGSWLDLPWHVALSNPAKRELLRSAGDLLQWRGTKRGLVRLFKCLAGKGATVTVTDVTAERTPIRLGGKGIPGAVLRGLLAGRRSSAGTLGGKAVLGRTRLACQGRPENPIDILVPTLLVSIEGDAATKTATAPYLDSILAQYAPAGIRYRVGWETVASRRLEDGDGLILEGQGPGILGHDSRLGRMLLAGRARTQIGTGFEMGFHLR